MMLSRRDPFFADAAGGCRHIFARNPSRHRRPFRMWDGSYDDRRSKDVERSCSIAARGSERVWWMVFAWRSSERSGEGPMVTNGGGELARARSAVLAASCKVNKCVRAARSPRQRPTAAATAIRASRSRIWHQRSRIVVPCLLRRAGRSMDATCSGIRCSRPQDDRLARDTNADCRNTLSIHRNEHSFAAGDAVQYAMMAATVTMVVMAT